MTWLPISLKNAAKCDKWYQLQNHLITESLNAKGAREKLLVGDPRACRILSVEQKHNRLPPSPHGECVGTKGETRVSVSLLHSVAAEWTGWISDSGHFHFVWVSKLSKYNIRKRRNRHLV